MLNNMQYAKCLNIVSKHLFSRTQTLKFILKGVIFNKKHHTRDMFGHITHVFPRSPRSGIFCNVKKIKTRFVLMIEVGANSSKQAKSIKHNTLTFVRLSVLMHGTNILFICFI